MTTIEQSRVKIKIRESILYLVNLFSGLSRGDGARALIGGSAWYLFSVSVAAQLSRLLSILSGV